MPSTKDKKKLEDAGYRVLPTCAFCIHCGFALSDWTLGKCVALDVRVVGMGQCRQFALAEQRLAAFSAYEGFYDDAELLLRQIMRHPSNESALDRVRTAHESIGLLAKKARDNLTDREREILDKRFGPNTKLATHCLSDIEVEHDDADDS